MKADTPDATLADVLRGQEEAWRQRPLLRQLYREWHIAIRDRLAKLDGLTVELGAGFGAFQETVPEAIATDVEPTPWADAVVDAAALPYDDVSLANLVLIDVFHHLGAPRRFLAEAQRTLAPGGRVLILDPYCSPVSTRAYRMFHHEPTDLNGPALDEDPVIGADPLRSNQARATLVFFREANRYALEWPRLPVVEKRRFALLRYPLSGGFSGKQLLPTPVAGAVAAIERALAPLSPLLAFRCLVVLERT